MRIILLQEVSNLGKVGEVKNVANGYARNFLIPKGLVEPATEQNLKMLAQRLAALQTKEERERTRYRTLAEKLQATPLRFTLRVGECGQAFGSITSQDIAEELAKNGIQVEKGWIELAQPIKATGEHSVKIKLPHQITAKVKVIVEVEK